jgi:hypothetical protein
MSPTVVAGEVIEGEFKISWNKNSPEDVRRAKEAFQEYTEKGWLATGESDGRKRQIFSFDPNLEKIVLFPVILGG